MNQNILRADASGMPLEWINYQEAAKLYHLGHVLYTCGMPLYHLHGGFNAKTGRQSTLEINSIVATNSKVSARLKVGRSYAPPLCNHTLFKRDNSICLYCGKRFLDRDLSRDHVTPISLNGIDHWTNVVTACKRCNNHKAGRTPEQAGMQLLAVPFIPTHAEYIYLQGRRVLADQMGFLRAHFPRKSPLHNRIC
ncbi:MAG: HNH endonuclease [Methylococcales bacterium]